jgi:hypothetical protein
MVWLTPFANLVVVGFSPRSIHNQNVKPCGSARTDILASRNAHNPRRQSTMEIDVP